MMMMMMCGLSGTGPVVVVVVVVVPHSIVGVLVFLSHFTLSAAVPLL